MATKKKTKGAAGTAKADKVKQATKAEVEAAAKASRPAATPAPAPDADLTAKQAAFAKAKEAAAAARAEVKRLGDEAKAKAKTAREEAKAAREAVKAAKADAVPDLVEQLDEHGKTELVDRNRFPFEVVCDEPGCTEHRWVTKSGLLEVTKCKPHARKTRRKRVMAGRKGRAKQAMAIVAEAMEMGLFPEAFKAKWSL